LEEILHQAERLGKGCDWAGAVGLYEKALKLLPQDDFSRIGEIHEPLGYASYRSAFQAESNDEFRERLRQAILSYEKAKEFYGRLNEAVKASRILRCDAMIAYWGYWLAAEVPERKRLLDECWRMGKEDLKAYDEAGDQHGYGETCLGLADCLDERLDLELDMQMREKIIAEALSFGEKAIKIFSKAGAEHELARAYCITSIHCFNAAQSLQLETKRRECEQKAFEYAKEAIRISESIGDKLLLGRSTICLGLAELDLGAGAEVALKLFKKALPYCAETKDHRILSEVFDSLGYSIFFTMAWEEDLEIMREKSRKCEEYASRAINCNILIGYGRGIPHSYSFGYVWNLTELASRETELERRHELLEKAVALGKQGLEHAQHTGSTHEIFHIASELSHALYDLSTLRAGDEKRELLVEAMTLGEKAVYYTDQLRPYYTLPKALPYGALAHTLFELSKLEERRDKRQELLEKSISRMETCITFIQRHVTSFPSRRELFILGARFQTELGNILNQLYQTTGEKEIMRKLIETYQSAAEMNRKAELVSRVAETYWRIAVAYDHLGDCSASASNFELASKQYELCAQNIPQLNTFYMDYAAYMQAWNDIEGARHNHEREEYGLSKECYEKAASALKSSKSWSYLAQNYLAWAQVEHAEDVSRKEQSEEALQTFEQAARLFTDTKKSLETKLGEIENLDEKTMATNLIKASDTRREFCLGRMALEEAKILDKKGDHFLSSQKYGAAAQIFEKIIQAIESEQEKNEFRLIAILSQAWQRMTRAEAEESPHLYLEASQLFEEAKDLSPNEQAKILTLGHSRFCRALEVGTRFVDTRDPNLHTTAIQHLESAATYYVKAGFRSASEYAKATEQLFDAYMHVDNAKRESDPEKKAKFYAMAEKILQTSAGSFMKAEHPEKREQVLRLLEKVKEERELATSLCEVLHTPPIVSTTTTFGTPAPTHESAVGSERFEHADIQASIVAHQKELKVGENLEIELELVNSGKGHALLTKITEIIPKGFQLAEKPSIYKLEDAYLNMRGRRLDPLKTEEVKLTLKPNVPGVFPLKPVILYLDESGKYKSHQPEPIIITVKEPEIEARPLEVPEGPHDRVITGHKVLDRLLLGGIPQNYGVVLTSPSCDDRDLLVESFLKTGIEKGEVTFYVTINPDGVKNLTKIFQSNFYAFVCNPQADAIVGEAPNVFKLKGVENLTDISIALASAIHKLDATRKQPRRICIEIISDVLLQHQAIQTRRWLTALMTELKSTGFTTLASMNSQMHPQQELQAILDLFEGEINIYEKSNRKYLKIKRMSNQKYSDDELLLKKEQP